MNILKGEKNKWKYTIKRVTSHHKTHPKTNSNSIPTHKKNIKFNTDQHTESNYRRPPYSLSLTRLPFSLSALHSLTRALTLSSPFPPRSALFILHASNTSNPIPATEAPHFLPPRRAIVQSWCFCCSALPFTPH